MPTHSGGERGSSDEPGWSSRLGRKARHSLDKPSVTFQTETAQHSRPTKSEVLSTFHSPLTCKDHSGLEGLQNQATGQSADACPKQLTKQHIKGTWVVTFADFPAVNTLAVTRFQIGTRAWPYVGCGETRGPAWGGVSTTQTPWAKQRTEMTVKRSKSV